MTVNVNNSRMVVLAHMHTHITHIYCCWLYDIGNIGISTMVIRYEVTTISIFFYSSKHSFSYKVIGDRLRLLCSLSISFGFFSLLSIVMGCALMKYWLETSRWLSQLFSKVDNHHLMCKFWSCLIDIHLRRSYKFLFKLILGL